MTSNYFTTLQKIRKSYTEKWDDRFDVNDPYKFDHWFEWMSPTESNVWGAIRYLGLPFYAQYPVQQYYADFADPVKKIIIEVDGKVHDDPRVKARDQKRQLDLEAKGWKFVRIKGWMTFKTREDYDLTENEINNITSIGNEIPEGYVRSEFWTECAEGILTKLKQKYYLSP